MKIADLVQIIDGKFVCYSSEEDKNRDITHGFASDLMSDVLTLNKDNIVLITGLANIQTIRTAEMADISCIVFARNKKVSTEMIEMAKANGTVIIGCNSTVFNISGKLYKAGLEAIY